MASVKIIPGHNANRDGLVGIYIMIVHDRKKVYIPIKGLKITDGNFDTATYIKNKEPNVKNVKLTNERLREYHLKAIHCINTLAANNILAMMDITELSNAVSLACFNASISREYTFGTYTDKLVSQLKESLKYGNAECYRQTKEFVLSRMAKDIRFPELTYQALLKMQTAHFADGNGVNSLSFYMRTIRAIYNRAVKDGIASKDHSPFAAYPIKTIKTAKRAITLDDFKKVKELVVDASLPEYHAHKYFLFSFYMRGMNFVDMANLKISDIQADRVRYARAKTGKQFNIQITPQAREILDIYTPGKGPLEYVFPIIKRKSDAGKFADVKSQRRFYNQLLKRISKSVELPNSLTSYVARHSWATIAKFSGLSVELISEGLGHSDTKTTQIYLDSFPDDIMDRAGLTIANLLDKTPEKQETTPENDVQGDR
ncbi:MAG: site-specific integrase [Bacteroidota bacterium]